MDFIDKVGLELEGGWDTPLDKPVFSDGLILKTDESLASIEKEDGTICNHIGEAISPPLEVEDAIAWLHAHHPTHTRGPARADGWGGCGLHIHTSFKKPTYYDRIGSNAFYAFFFQTILAFISGLDEKLYERAMLYNRLFGKNKYCVKGISNLGRQVVSVDKRTDRDVRRTQLNFPRKMHGTVECRIFPMFSDPQLSEHAVRTLINAYNTFLIGKGGTMIMQGGVNFVV